MQSLKKRKKKKKELLEYFNISYKKKERENDLSVKKNGFVALVYICNAFVVVAVKKSK